MSPVFALFGWGNDRLPQGSGMAAQVDSIILGLLIAAATVILVLGTLTVFILFRYRRGSPANRAALGIPTWKIETTWTLATLAVFLYFFVRGASVYIDMERVPADGETVHVVARQWMWDVRYGDGRREFNVLHLRQNTPARILLTSEDVIHSFYVPAFRMKQDVVPGRMVSAAVTPDRTGTYTLYCAQYCGTAHAEMIGTVVVLAPAEYNAWRQGAGIGVASAGLSPVTRGRMVYVKYGCGLCHEDRAADRAPSLAGLNGSRVRLQGGAFVIADEQYLHDSILLAPKYVVPGYSSTMPTYAGIIGETEAADLVSYVESLRPEKAPLAINP